MIAADASCPIVVSLHVCVMQVSLVIHVMCPRVKTIAAEMDFV